MAYLTESQLSSAAVRSRMTMDSLSSGVQNFSQANAVTIFISHSHLDREYVQGFIQLLKELGINAYVDWNDSNMPKVTNRETAETIKKEIIKNQLFLMLATENSLKSKWVPWEVGIADQAKQSNQIFVVPVIKDNGSFTGNEYLQLYTKIILADDNKLAAFKPNITQGKYLREVLSSGGYRG